LSLSLIRKIAQFRANESLKTDAKWKP
jgi:hypothetical protein